jgi:serine/threonine protein kinase/phosphoribosyl 1,2-cyclic phosphodiesterase/tetratricopeptide (TPR) repeat protein/anti-anti-sigma regulatory factor
VIKGVLVKVRFWGVRGSIPTPLSSTTIEEKIVQAIQRMPSGFDTRDEKAVRNFVAGLPPLERGTAGGNTACVEVRGSDTTVIIDAGSGIRELGQQLMRGPCGKGQGVLHLFVSHPHWDHIQGFPFFVPAFIKGNRILVYSVHDLRAALSEQQRPLNFPIPLTYMQASIEFVPLTEGVPFTAGEFNVEILRNNHPGDAYSFRITDRHTTLVYASDAEYKGLSTEELAPRIKFFRNADALIFDAQYNFKEAMAKIDWGHSSAMDGVDMARAANARRLVLFHHDPTYSDKQLEKVIADARIFQEQDSTRPPVQIMIAQEGMSLDLTPAGVVDLEFLRDSQTAVLKPASTFDEEGVAQIASRIASLETLLALNSTFIDLTEVETLSVASLKALVHFSHARNSGPLVLVSPSPAVQQVIKLGGYSDFFAIYPSREAASAANRLREELGLPGQLLKGRYRIEEQVGVNRLGTALRAFDIIDSYPAAIKVLASSFSPQTIGRLLRQAPQLTALSHGNIRRLYAVEQEAGTTFIVYEWFHTMQTLEQRLARGPLRIDETLTLAIELAQALHYLHGRGVVHGDLNTHNLYITDQGLKLNNVGIGRLEEGRNLIETPLILLNAAYLAPEQIIGESLDARSDLYALGVLLYRLFTGQLPFNGTDQEVMRAHLEQEPLEPRKINPAISLGLEHLMLRLLAKNPNERYATAHQVAQILGSLAIGSGEALLPRQNRLFGRDVLLQELRTLWEQAAAGHGQLALLSGEPGVGKTSLAQELAQQSGAAVVLIGHCSDLPPTPAYGPAIEIVRAFIATVPVELQHEELRTTFAVLARNVPELRELVPGLPEVPLLEPRQEQIRLMSATHQVVEVATQRRPWLMIIDDLQWIDSGSLELLRYLARQLPDTALLIIGTYRDDELPAGHPLYEALREISRYPGYKQFTLDRLSESATNAMLAAIWERPVPAELSKLIYRHTEGNPFYVEALARGLIDDGLVPTETDAPLPVPAEVRLPETMRDAVWRRIRHLSPDTQTLLRQAAVLGPTFSFPLLHELSRLKEWEVLEHLDTVLERQLVREAAQEGMLSFSHAEIYHVLYADLATTRKRRLHREAAQAIERLAGAHVERYAAELARHYCEANESEEAVRYSLMAAKQAAAAYANETALNLYDQALAFIDRMGPEEAPTYYEQLLEVYEELIKLLRHVGRWDNAMHTLQAALTLTRALEDRGRRARFQVMLGDLLCRQGNYVEGNKILAQALENFEKEGNQVGIARVLNTQGGMAAEQGEYDKALALIEQGLVIRQELNDTQGIAELLNNRGIIAAFIGDYDQAESDYKESLRLYESLGEQLFISKELVNLGDLAFHRGDYAEAQAYTEEAIKLVRIVGDTETLAVALNNLGLIFSGQGDHASARAYTLECFTLAHQIGSIPTLIAAFETMSVINMLAGDPQQALVLAGVSAALRDEFGIPLAPVDLQRLETTLAPAYAALGERAEECLATGRATSLEDAITLVRMPLTATVE